MEQTLIDLVNPDITLTYKGETLSVRKATIRQVLAYQERRDQIFEEKQRGGDQRLAAFGVYLLLKDKVPNLTEDDVLDNMPGNVNVLELLGKLGFIEPEKLEMMKRLQNQSSGTKSSPPSPQKPDGPQNKSETSPSDN